MHALNGHNKSINPTSKILLAQHTLTGTVCNLNGYPNLHVRAQGDEYSPIVKDLPAGTQVQVLGEAGGWYHIDANGTVGWVYSNYLSVNGSVGNENVNVQKGYENTYGTVANLDGYPYLHMRSNGTIGAPIIKDLPSGTQVKVLGENGGWYNIQVDGMTGWVYSNYLSVNGHNTSTSQNTSSNTTVLQSSSTSYATGTVCNLDGYPYLHVRSQGDEYSQILKDLPAGTQVQVLGEAGGWYHIDANGTVGWVYSNYLSVGNHSTKTSNVSSSKYGKGVVYNLNGYPYLHVRSNGTTGAPIIKHLVAGTVVNVLGEAGGWYEIESNGTTGWVYSEYLRVGNSVVSQNQNHTTYATVGNLDGYPELHIRANSTVNSKQIGYLTNGYIVKVLQKMNNGWYKIKCQNGLIGYVDGAYLNF